MPPKDKDSKTGSATPAIATTDSATAAAGTTTAAAADKKDEKKPVVSAMTEKPEQALLSLAKQAFEEAKNQKHRDVEQTLVEIEELITSRPHIIYDQYEQSCASALDYLHMLAELYPDTTMRFTQPALVKHIHPLLKKLEQQLIIHYPFAAPEWLTRAENSPVYLYYSHGELEPEQRRLKAHARQLTYEQYCDIAFGQARALRDAEHSHILLTLHWQFIRSNQRYQDKLFEKRWVNGTRFISSFYRYETVKDAAGKTIVDYIFAAQYPEASSAILAEMLSFFLDRRVEFAAETLIPLEYLTTAPGVKETRSNFMQRVRNISHAWTSGMRRDRWDLQWPILQIKAMLLTDDKLSVQQIAAAMRILDQYNQINFEFIELAQQSPLCKKLTIAALEYLIARQTTFDQLLLIVKSLEDDSTYEKLKLREGSGVDANRPSWKGLPVSNTWFKIIKMIKNKIIEIITDNKAVYPDFSLEKAAKPAHEFLRQKRQGYDTKNTSSDDTASMQTLRKQGLLDEKAKPPTQPKPLDVSKFSEPEGSVEYKIFSACNLICQGQLSELQTIFAPDGNSWLVYLTANFGNFLKTQLSIIANIYINKTGCYGRQQYLQFSYQIYIALSQLFYDDKKSLTLSDLMSAIKFLGPQIQSDQNLMTLLTMARRVMRVLPTAPTINHEAALVSKDSAAAMPNLGEAKREVAANDAKHRPPVSGVAAAAGGSGGAPAISASIAVPTPRHKL